MALSQRQRDEQARLESALPDRFEAADEWIALANKSRGLVGGALMRAAAFYREMGQPVPFRAYDVYAPRMWELRSEYETLRMRAKRPSLSGIENATRTLNNYYIDLRGTTDPNKINGLKQAVYIVQQYLLSPDRRAPFSKLLRDLDIVNSKGQPL